MALLPSNSRPTAVLLSLLAGGVLTAAVSDYSSFSRTHGPYWWDLLPEDANVDPQFPWKGPTSAYRTSELLSAERNAAKQSLEQTCVDSYAVRHENVDEPGFGSAKRAVFFGADGVGSFWTRNIFGSVSGLPLNVTTPNFDRVRAMGAFSDIARVVFPTVSGPNWMAMFAGAGPEETGVMYNGWYLGNQMAPVTGARTYFPSMFRVLRNADPDTKTAMWGEWNGIWDMLDPLDIDLGRIPRRPVPVYAKEFVDMVIKNEHFTDFDVAVFYTGEADAGGHYTKYGSPMYYEALQRVDAALGIVLDAIEETYGWNDTLLVMGSDHGGDFFDHVQRDPYERHFFTPVLAAGAGIKSNVNLKCPTAGYPCFSGRGRGGGLDVRNMDIPSTVLHALGVRQPEIWVGRPLVEAWDPDYKAPQRRR